MENRRRFIVYCCIVAVLLAIIAGVSIAQYGSKPVALHKPVAVYQEAVNRLNGQSSICLNITYDKTTTINTQVFREQSQQVLTYEGLGTEEMVGYMEETLLIGDYSISLVEIYNDQKGYVKIGDKGFCSNMTQEEYMARFIPAVMINPELYAKINGSVSKTETIIYFSYGAAAESWAAKSGTKDISSQAVAYLDPDGNLKKTEYQLSYEINGAKTTLYATVELQQAKSPNLPDDLRGYIPIDYFDGPKDLEVACGHLLMANCSTAAYNDTISCEAFGDIRKQNIDVKTCSSDSWSAQVDTKITMENSGKAGVTSTTQKTESFENNTYIVRTDGGAPNTGNIRTEDMQAYCHDILVATIMLPEYITGAKLTENEDSYHIEFTGNEDFAKMLGGEACSVLYQDQDILTNLAQGYDTNDIRCYLTLDKESRLPIASGFTYKGTYSISNLPYSLLYQADQNYNLLTTK